MRPAVRRTAAALTLALGALASCRGCRSNVHDAAPDRADAAQAARANPGRDAGRAPARAPLDLLHFTPSVVAVSSTVANPRDFPQHLIDDRVETAWNSRTGDLVGGWLAFRVPRDARVRRIELHAGFDKRTPTLDLFTANVRIARVRVSRDGHALGDFALDPARRDGQPLTLDAPGGDFRIDVLEVVPGTRRAWRELCVSELRVFGLPGVERSERPRMPVLRVGGLDAPVADAASAIAVPAPDPLGPGPFPDPSAFCRAYDAAITPRIDAKYTPEEYPGELPGPHCSSEPAIPLAHPRFRALVPYTVDDLEAHSTRVGVLTPRGFFPLPIDLETRGHGDPGCGYSTEHALEPAELRGDELRIRVLRRTVQDGSGDEVPASTEDERWLWVCREDAAGIVRCGDAVKLAERRVEQALEGPPEGAIHWDTEYPAP